MDRTMVRKTTLSEQDEALCLSLCLDERLKVIEDLNRQGRILAGFPAFQPMDRSFVPSAVRRCEALPCGCARGN